MLDRDQIFIPAFNKEKRKGRQSEVNLETGLYRIKRLSDCI